MIKCLVCIGEQDLGAPKALGAPKREAELATRPAIHSVFGARTHTVKIMISNNGR